MLYLSITMVLLMSTSGPGPLVRSGDVSGPTETTQTSPLPSKADLKPRAKFIRTYSGMKDWRGRTMTYHVNLPPDFHPDRKYPILFEWHGKGGGPGTFLFPGVYGLTGHIHVGLTYPEGCRYGTALLYATKEYTALIRHVYDDVVQNFNGNPEYVFIGGYSAGGFMTTGPGISLLIRSGLKDRLAGVVAGGCNWMCNPKYAHGLDILLWYADNDPNSYDLPNRLPEVRKYARSLTVMLHKGAGHCCDNDFEGPAIRRFFALHGPDSRDFETLYRIEKNQDWLADMRTSSAIVDKRNTASVMARQLLDKGLKQLEGELNDLIRNCSRESSMRKLRALAIKYFDFPPAAQVVRNALQIIGESQRVDR